MTDQELFEAASGHMLRQGRASFRNGHFLYRGPDGLRSPIGIFIPDEKYDDDLEVGSVQSPRVYKRAGIAKSQLWLAVELEAIHEKLPPSAWRQALSDLADANGMNLIVPDDAQA